MFARRYHQICDFDASKNESKEIEPSDLNIDLTTIVSPKAKDRANEKDMRRGGNIDPSHIGSEHKK